MVFQIIISRTCVDDVYGELMLTCIVHVVCIATKLYSYFRVGRGNFAQIHSFSMSSRKRIYNSNSNSTRTLSYNKSSSIPKPNNFNWVIFRYLVFDNPDPSFIRTKKPFEYRYQSLLSLQQHPFIIVVPRMKCVDKVNILVISCFPVLLVAALY